MHTLLNARRGDSPFSLRPPSPPHTRVLSPCACHRSARPWTSPRQSAPTTERFTATRCGTPWHQVHSANSQRFFAFPGKAGDIRSGVFPRRPSGHPRPALPPPQSDAVGLGDGVTLHDPSFFKNKISNCLAMSEDARHNTWRHSFSRRRGVTWGLVRAEPQPEQITASPHE